MFRIGGHRVKRCLGFVAHRGVPRKAGGIGDRRDTTLDAYGWECGGSPTAGGAPHAFLDTDPDPYIRGLEGWGSWGAFGGQLGNTPYRAELINEHVDSVVLQLIEMLKRAMADTPDG